MSPALATQQQQPQQPPQPWVAEVGRLVTPAQAIIWTYRSLLMRASVIAFVIIIIYLVLQFMKEFATAAMAAQ